MSDDRTQNTGDGVDPHEFDGEAGRLLGDDGCMSAADFERLYEVGLRKVLLDELARDAVADTE